MRRGVVVKLKGEVLLLEKVLELIEQRTNGIVSNVMSCDDSDDYHAFCTVFEVVE